MSARQQNNDEIMGLLREALYEYGDMQKLANFCGLSLACIARIRSGKTRWPRFETIEVLMIPLKLRLQLVRWKE